MRQTDMRDENAQGDQFPHVVFIPLQKDSNKRNWSAEQLSKVYGRDDTATQTVLPPKMTRNGKFIFLIFSKQPPKGDVTPLMARITILSATLLFMKPKKLSRWPFRCRLVHFKSRPLQKHSQWVALRMEFSVRRGESLEFCILYHSPCSLTMWLGSQLHFPACIWLAFSMCSACAEFPDFCNNFTMIVSARNIFCSRSEQAAWSEGKHGVCQNKRQLPSKFSAWLPLKLRHLWSPILTANSPRMGGAAQEILGTVEMSENGGGRWGGRLWYCNNRDDVTMCLMKRWSPDFVWPCQGATLTAWPTSHNKLVKKLRSGKNRQLWSSSPACQVSAANRNSRNLRTKVSNYPPRAAHASSICAE